jgi:hypothetical protein
MSALEEIERAVQKLRPEEFVKFDAWMDQYRTEAAKQLSAALGNPGGDWFQVYMSCPGTFEIPLRKKQFYTPEK